jgi:hypothetical protein
LFKLLRQKVSGLFGLDDSFVPLFTTLINEIKSRALAIGCCHRKQNVGQRLKLTCTHCFETTEDPDNRFCADCPIKGPTWASVNIGVWICMPCSGIHRSLGVHITQVRSVDLDKWKPEWVEVMKTWGNSKANAVWEAKLPEDYDGKPTEVEAQELTPKMQKFIKDKYERKKWYSESRAQAMAKKAEKKKEEEGSDDSDDDKAKKTTAKKPVIVMKVQAPAAAAAPAQRKATSPRHVKEKAAENLLDDFDPFNIGPATTTPAIIPPPSQPAAFVQAPPAPAPVAVAAPKPGIDLNFLYGAGAPAGSSYGQQQPQGGQQWMPQQPTWNAGGAMPQQQQQQFGGMQPMQGYGAPQQQQQQGQWGGGTFL